MLEVIGPDARRKVPPYCLRWKLSWILWLAMVRRGSSDRNHSQRETAGAILDQFSLASQPAKISKSIWEMKERSSMTLGLFRGVAGKPSMLQKPKRTWPSALSRGRGSPNVASSGNRDGGGIVLELLLLLLFIYVGPAVEVGNGCCRLGSINGTAEGRGGGSKLGPEKERVSCRYVGVPRGPCAALGIGGGRDVAARDPGTSWLKDGGGELIQEEPGDGAGAAGGRGSSGWLGLLPAARVRWHGARG